MDYIINVINKVLDLLFEVKGYVQAKSLLESNQSKPESADKNTSENDNNKIIINFKDLYEKWKKLK